MPRGVPMEKRARRKFTAEYKAEVVRLVRDGGKTIGQVSRDLDLTATAVRHWGKQAGGGAGGGGGGAVWAGGGGQVGGVGRGGRGLGGGAGKQRKEGGSLARER